MGNTCNAGDVITPDTTNVCNKKGETHTVPGFCAVQGIGAKPSRSEFCAKLSNAGEWIVDDDNFTGCPFRPGSNNTQNIPCCDGLCRLPGHTLGCIRENFTGDKLQCCRNNYDNKPADGREKFCFSDIAKQNTCDPDYRDINSNACREELGKYCSGTLDTDDPRSTQWLNRWYQNGPNGELNCTDVIYQNVFKNFDDGTSESELVKVFLKFNVDLGLCNTEIPENILIKADGLYWAKSIIQDAMIKYTEQGFTIGSLPGSRSSNPWEIFIYQNICCPLPGVCQEGLGEVCADKTMDQMSINTLLAQWCGCHMPNENYLEYSQKYNIQKPCTPVCNRLGTIPLTGINNNPINCKQNICVIDDISIDIINTQIGGGLNINQLCNNCTGGQCTCIISNSNIEIRNSIINNNVNAITNKCGTFNCTTLNPGTNGMGPTLITVPCSDINYNPYEEYDKELTIKNNQARKNSWIYTIIIALLALVAIYLIILYVHPSSIPKGLTINNEV